MVEVEKIRQAWGERQEASAGFRALLRPELAEPAHVVALLEVAWRKRCSAGPVIPLTADESKKRQTEIASAMKTMLVGEELTKAVAGTRCFRWDHLIYAYCVESTRLVEVFARVIEKFVADETIGIPDAPVRAWLDVTEALVFKPPFPYSALAVTSALRPDAREVRRNAYARMFNMDLSYMVKDGRPYGASLSMTNKEFLPTFFRLLEEVWAGIINQANEIGPNTASAYTASELCKKLQHMFLDRRLKGNLEREEFAAVATMSWLRQAIDGDDSPIVRALDAEAHTPSQRLRKIADKAGVTVPDRNDAFLELAEPLSNLFGLIESGLLSTPDGATALFKKEGLAGQMELIISQWYQATGQDAKAAARKL